MIRRILCFLVIAGVCSAQQPEPIGVMQNKVEVKPAPLKCGKYEHVEHWPDGQCGPEWCDKDGNVCFANCPPPPPDRCVPDLHTVTEKEWQELMKRMNDLEERLKCYGRPCFTGNAK